jgi:hypothetical protein
MAESGLSAKDNPKSVSVSARQIKSVSASLSKCVMLAVAAAVF